MGLRSHLCDHFPFGPTVTNSTEYYRERSRLALMSRWLLSPVGLTDCLSWGALSYCLTFKQPWSISVTLNRDGDPVCVCGNGMIARVWGILRVSFCLTQGPLTYNQITKACRMKASSMATLGIRWSKLAVCAFVCGSLYCHEREKCTPQTHQSTMSLHFLG